MSKSNKGFTLLEVMIAVTILTIAFAAILSSQSGSINLTRKSKEMNIAGWLLQNIMVESEHLYEGKPFGEIPLETVDKFPEPFNQYQWKRQIKELHLPDLIAGADNASVPEPVRLLTKSITNYLNKAIREMVITVSWERGEGQQKVSIATYLIDINAEFTVSL